jgi:hypothetical protein
MNIGFGSFASRLISFGITGAMLLGCWSAVSGDGHAFVLRKRPTQVARLGREFKLRAGHQVTLKREGLRIKFAAVTEDSRCPAGVQCIWAGNAAVRLELSVRGGGSKSLTLNTNGGPSHIDEDQYQGYKVKLVELNPYPRSDHQIAAGNYVATLLVAKD